jgi:hypothetical protein
VDRDDCNTQADVAMVAGKVTVRPSTMSTRPPSTVATVRGDWHHALAEVAARLESLTRLTGDHVEGSGDPEGYVEHLEEHLHLLLTGLPSLRAKAVAVNQVR